MKVTTIYGWSGTITDKNEKLYKFGQGISITRDSDNAKFNISPSDIV